MANCFWADALDGSTNGIKTISAANISDGDMCIVILHATAKTYIYRYDSSSTAADSAPQSIRPTDYGSAGVWLWTKPVMDSLRLRDAIIDNANTSVNEFSTDGTLAGNSDSAVPTEKAIKTYTTTTLGQGLTQPFAQGYFKRPMFSYKDGDEIYISGGGFWTADDLDQAVYTSSKLTFQFGSGGSNAGSDDLDNGAIEIQYLYLDSSAIGSAGGTALVASDFYNAPTTPTFSRGGWYLATTGEGDGLDRCVGAFLITAANALYPFAHNGNEQYILCSDISLYAAADSDTTQDIDVYSPCNIYGKVYLQWDAVTGNADTYYVTNGDGGSRIPIYQYSETQYPGNTAWMAPDSSNQIHGNWAAATTGTMRIRQRGYKVPGGM